MKNLDPRTKITFEVEQDNHKVQYEGFIEQTDDKQVLHLKGTLTVEGEEKEKNDDKGRQSTVSKITLLLIGKDMDAQEIIDYLTDKYSAKFEKQEGTEFSDNIKKEEKTPGNMSQTQIRSIGEPDDIYIKITDLTDEILALYQQQTNNKDGGAKSVNKILQTCWNYELNDKNAMVTIVPTMEDPSKQDENPILNGVIVSVDYNNNNIIGKLNVNADFKKVSEDLKNFGAKYLDDLTNYDIARSKVAGLRITKEDQIQETAEWPANKDEFRKFLNNLYIKASGMNNNLEEIKKYILDSLNNVNDNIKIEVKAQQPEQNQAQSQGNGNEGNPVNASKEEDNNPAVNEGGQVKPIASGDIQDYLKNRNVTVSCGKEQIDDVAVKVVNNVALRVTFGKLYYKANDDYKNVTINLDFCSGVSGKQGKGQYAIILSINGPDDKPIAETVQATNCAGLTLPTQTLCNYTFIGAKNANMSLSMGERKQEESLNEKKDKLQFTASYKSDIKESYSPYITVVRTIECNGDCSDYYMISESVWGDGSVTDPKTALYQGMRKLFNTCRDKSSLMEYAKANQNVQFGKYAQTVTYDVPKSHGFTGNDGCPLYECCVALKFNGNDNISNAINLGVHKISF